MTKPHEQTWTKRENETGVVVMDAGRGTCIIVHAPLDERAAAGDLISAAPDMARELAHLVRLMEPLEKEGGFDIPGLATLNGARAALRKARVRP